MLFALIFTHPDSDGTGIEVYATALSREDRTRGAVYDDPKDADSVIRKLKKGHAVASPTDPDTTLQWVDVQEVVFRP